MAPRESAADMDPSVLHFLNHVGCDESLVLTAGFANIVADVRNKRRVEKATYPTFWISQGV